MLTVVMAVIAVAVLAVFGLFVALLIGAALNVGGEER